MDLGIVVGDGLGHFLEQGRLTGLGLRDDHTALSLTHRAHQVHDTHGNTGAGLFQADPLIGEDGGHIFKIESAGRLLRRIAVDGLHIQKGVEFLPLGLDPDIAVDNIAGLEIEAPDLAGRNIDIRISRHIVGAADKAEAVGHDLQDAVGQLAAVQLAHELILVENGRIGADIPPGNAHILGRHFLGVCFVLL